MPSVIHCSQGVDVLELDSCGIVVRFKLSFDVFIYRLDEKTFFFSLCLFVLFLVCQGYASVSISDEMKIKGCQPCFLITRNHLASHNVSASQM